MGQFWHDWIDRFNSNTGKYITPNTDRVEEFSDGVNVPDGSDKKQIAKEAWVYIANNTTYILTEEWKSPDETIADKSGDCEDLVFLYVSMLPNLGVNDAKVVIGYLERQTGGGGPHVWADVDGMTVDPTSFPGEAKNIKYNKVHEFKMEFTNNARQEI